MCLDQPEMFSVAAARAAARRGARRPAHHAAAHRHARRSARGAQAARRSGGASSRRAASEFRSDVPLGVMIETPAAAVAGDTLTHDVDFFSIGTNDLVQYTLAVDRGNANLAPRFTPLHPAVLRLIKRTVEVAELARHRSRRVRRDGVAAAHGVRADRTRRAAAERRAAIGAAREADRAQRDRGAAKLAASAALRALTADRRATSWRVVCRRHRRRAVSL